MNVEINSDSQDDTELVKRILNFYQSRFSGSFDYIRLNLGRVNDDNGATCYRVQIHIHNKRGDTYYLEEIQAGLDQACYRVLNRVSRLVVRNTHHVSVIDYS